MFVKRVRQQVCEALFGLKMVIKTGNKTETENKTDTEHYND